MKKTTKTFIVIIGIICLYAGTSVAAVNPATETYTGITTSGHVGSDYPFFSDYTQNGTTTITNTHHKDANISVNSDGYLDGQGFADFGLLRNRLELGGPSGLEGFGKSIFNDHWTIDNPSLTGQQGTMTLAFDLSGSVSVLDTFSDTVLSDEYAGVGLIVDINPNQSSNGTRVLDYNTSLGSGQMQINGTQGSPTATLPIDFTYGTEFTVRTILYTSALSDNQYLGYTTNPSFFEFYGGGTIGSITVDFMNTAQLGAIVLPDDPLTRLESSSLTDYTSLITDTLPIPEPASLCLLAIGGIALLRRKGTTREY
jgi:hypothetical protein